MLPMKKESAVNQGDDMRAARRAALEIATKAGMPLVEWRQIDTGNLAGYIRHSFKIAEAVVGERRYTLFETLDEAVLSARQIEIWTRSTCARSGLHGHPVLVTSHMTRRKSEKLIELGVSFVRPGRHFSVEGLDRVMADRFDPPRPEESHPRPEGSLGAYAQAILILQILRGDPEPDFPANYASTLSITQMTALKASDELVDAGFCSREKDGKPHPLEFIHRGRDLFEAALPVLASPVSHVGYLAGIMGENVRPNSGEWALAMRSMLSEPSMATYAEHRTSPLLSIASWAGMVICNEEDADLRVERWRYPPQALSFDGMADPISLFLMFRDHHDERVEICAREMIEEYWKKRDIVRSAGRPAA
ncbi:hypothetical protein D3C71_544860 [compost metagenome]